MEGNPAVKRILLLLLGICVAAQAAETAKKAVTVEQLVAAVGADAGKPDAAVAEELSGMSLTERLGAATLLKLSAALPGEKSREALEILADSAAWRDPAASAVVARPTPDAAALRQMLVEVVGYVNTTLHQLPNFLATRSSTAFEDRPQSDVVDSIGTMSQGYLPMHQVGSTASGITYRDGREEAETKKASTKGAGVHGLVTAGEFGPFQKITVADALKGKITWARWEQDGDRVVAVFHFEVPAPESHYVVQFCCTREDLNESVATHIYKQTAAYHGEIAFDPSSGAIYRISVEGELGQGNQVEKAAMLVEYGPIQIAGKEAILPTRGVALLAAHVSPPAPGMHLASDMGPLKTYINETRFENYHQFRGEMRIVSDSATQP